MEMRERKNRKIREGAHFNLFDWVLLSTLTVAILLGGFTAWRQILHKEGAEGVVKYTVLLSGAETAMLDSAMEGDALIDVIVRSENGTAILGRVDSVRKEAHTVAVAGKRNVEFITVPDRADYYINVYADAQKKDGDGIRCSDIRIAAGDVMNLRVGTLLATGARVVHVSWEEV